MRRWGNTENESFSFFTTRQPKDRCKGNFLYNKCSDKRQIFISDKKKDLLNQGALKK